MLASPVVTQQVFTAAVLYGARANAARPALDEVALPEALAKAAALHRQARIAMLMRQTEKQKTRMGELEASSTALRELARLRLSGEHRAGGQTLALLPQRTRAVLHGVGRGAEEECNV